MTTTVRVTPSVREALRAQLLDRSRRLPEPGEPHPLEDPRRLRELDVAVVDDLPVVAPRVEEVVRGRSCAAPASRARSSVSAASSTTRPKWPATTGSASDGLEGDELVAQVHERHAPAAAAKRDVVEDPPEELEHLVDVADLDGDVVDPDEPRHRATLAARQRYAGSAQTPSELDDRRGRGGHVLHARPLAHRVVLLPAGEEVRGRQARATRARRRPSRRA